MFDDDDVVVVFLLFECLESLVPPPPPAAFLAMKRDKVFVFLFTPFIVAYCSLPLNKAQRCGEGSKEEVEKCFVRITNPYATGEEERAWFNRHGKSRIVNATNKKREMCWVDVVDLLFVKKNVLASTCSSNIIMVDYK